jgi:hypothetical protein
VYVIEAFAAAYIIELKPHGHTLNHAQSQPWQAVGEQ